MANLWVRVMVVVLGALIGSGACSLSHEEQGDEEPLFATQAMRVLDWRDNWNPQPASCVDMRTRGESSSFGSSFDGPPTEAPSLASVPESERESVMFEQFVELGGLRVVAKLNDERVESEFFTREFLETGELGFVEVETPLGNRIQVAYRGARVCESGVELFTE